jgi:hypothetical protein
MIKKVVLGTLVLILFSCGDLPEVKPTDWDSRLSFAGKPYTGTTFDEWDEIDLDAMKEPGSQYTQNISKSQRWKGSGKLMSGKRVYYILYAKSNVMVTVDWRYREDDCIGFAYKRVGLTEVSDYGFDTGNISMENDDYLVIRISSSAGSSDRGWELGFTVK